MIDLLPHLGSFGPEVSCKQAWKCNFGDVPVAHTRYLRHIREAQQGIAHRMPQVSGIPAAGPLLGYTVMRWPFAIRLLFQLPYSRLLPGAECRVASCDVYDNRTRTTPTLFITAIATSFDTDILIRQMLNPFRAIPRPRYIERPCRRLGGSAPWSSRVESGSSPRIHDVFGDLKH